MTRDGDHVLSRGGERADQGSTDISCGSDDSDHARNLRAPVTRNKD
jgi:hypothetical protein